MDTRFEQQSISYEKVGFPTEPDTDDTAVHDQPRPCSPSVIIAGPVMHGDKLGRTLGYPTANLELVTDVRPSYGVYASLVTLEDGRVFVAATNFGIRPTITPPKELLESHILDFAGDLYGQHLVVELTHFIRPELKFDTLEALTERMALDCTVTRRLVAGQ